MSEAEQVAQLTNVQILNALYALLKRVEAIEDVLIKFYEANKVHSEFLTTEVIKARLDQYGFDKVIKGRYTYKHTPQGMLLDLQNKLDGFITYHETKDANVKRKQNEAIPFK